MKKGGKVLLASCGVCAGIGVLLAISGIVSGGVGDLMNYGSGELLHLENDRWSEEEEDKDFEKLDALGELEFNGIKELEIELSHVQLILESSDSESFSVSTEDLPQDLQEDLVVSSEEESIWVGAGDMQRWKEAGKNYAGKVILHIPSNLEMLSVSMGTGTLDASDLRTEDLEISIGTGTAKVLGLDAEEVSVSVGTGTVEMEGLVQTELDIECGVGMVRYQDAGNVTDYNYSIGCGAGSIRLGEQTFSKVADTREIDHHAAKEMDIECGMGTVEISFMKGE